MDEQVDNLSITDRKMHANTTANDQHAVLWAIESVKQDMLAKLEEKAIAQSAELQNQITKIRTEI